MMERWSRKKAWEWYDNQPWLRGCNFLPSDCCNRIALWQELDFERHLATADRELGLAASIGFNSIRVILEFIVWDEQHDGFLERFERFLSVAAGHGISLLVCFANDCTIPRDENYRPPQLGPQPCDWGYHGGRKNSPHRRYDGAGYNPVLDEPEVAERFYTMVAEIVGKYAADPRIVAWDLFNEPGNGNRYEISFPHLQRIFDVARSMNPSQPLTTGGWRGSVQNWKPVEELALELSDVISYHCYGDYEANILMISNLREFGRPLFNTEWLNRICHNNVAEAFPLFFLEKVSCWNWGFVAGLSQTYEPYESMWKQYEENPALPFDFTKWMHDLFRPSLHPYDPKEIEIIRKYCRMADEKRAAQ